MAESQRTRFYAVHDFDLGSISINLDNVAFAKPYRDVDGRGIHVFFDGGRIEAIPDTCGGYVGLLAHLRLDGMVEAHDAAREEEEAERAAREAVLGGLVAEAQELGMGY